MIPNTIARMFVETCDRYAGRTDKAVYARKVGGVWQTLTHDDLRTRVEALALGLLAYGIVPGERMGIVSENRIEWAVADFAAACTGIIDVPVFPTLTAAQMAEVFGDCEASAIVVSNRLQLSKILSIRDALPALRLIIIMNDDVELAHGCVRFTDVEQRGQSSFDAQTRAMQLRAMAERITPDELLTLIYTSGTTGTPKGVMLTHGNITSNIAGALDAIPMSDSDVLLSYLPLCHSYERMAGYYLAFGVGASTWFAESIETVADNLAEVRPTVMTSVPRLFERIRNRVLSAAAKSPAPRHAIFQWAMRVGQQHRVKPTPHSRAQVRVADALVYSKIRERTGGRLRFFVSGGAALSVDVGSFFFMVGLPILEGYGLTETSPVLAVNRVGDETLGTVGPPLPNVELRIAADGEILARGPNVMKGYWKRPHETAEVIDPDGWFHTGDIGRFDDHGRLIITDRKKHLLVSSTGKNIAPQPIEQLLTQSPLIDQAMLIGNNREYCTALIVLDVEGVQGALRDQGVTVGDVYTSEVVHRLVWNDIARLQKDLSKYERVRRFTIIREPFTVENGLMTPTLKVRRKAVETRYSMEIEAMYSGPESDIP